MRRSPLAFDGLWYCLCPSFQLSYLHRPILLHKDRQKALRRCLSTGLSASTRHIEKSHSHDITENLGNDKNHKIAETKTQSDGYDRQSSKPKRPVSLKKIQRLEDNLERLLSKPEARITFIANAVRNLFRKYRGPPTSRHYKALILGNIDQLFGSSEHVQSLLREMEMEGITADSATLHAALETLAVHPDYLLRQEIIGALRARWLSLSPAGWHHFIAGLIREGQLELALDRVEHMERQGIGLEQWLHSLLVYNLCAVDELDEVLRLMRDRADKTKNISAKLWKYLLEVSLRASHLKMVNYVWKNTVDLSYADLDGSHCRDVLRLASHYGDSQLAESVFRQLIIKGESISQEDYEKVVQAYAATGDWKSGVEILCRMQDDGLALRPESTQPILMSLEKSMPDPALIWKNIVQLRRQKLNIPIGLANMVIEYCVAASTRGSIPTSRAVELALDIYRDIFDVCSTSADVNTFNNLFTLCRHAERPDACTFLAKEMASFEVVPDQLTLEALILMCLQINNFRSAYMYTLDLAGRGWGLSETVAYQIRLRCAGVETGDAAVLLKLISGSTTQISQAAVGNTT